VEDVSPFVESSGHGAEAFEGVDRSFDLVPAAIPGPVEADGPAALAATLLPVGPLVAALGDGMPDLPASQIAAVAAGAVRLVATEVPGSRWRR
jgi:hypothetical protein